jgi:S1-C subfamily serine protease
MLSSFCSRRFSGLFDAERLALRAIAKPGVAVRRFAYTAGALLVLAVWTSTAPAASNDDLADLETRFKAISAKASPAVVAISASTEADNSPAASRSSEMSSDKLQAFLSKTTRMFGTGFIVDSNGYILTNDHVIDDAEQLWITTDDRKVYPAIVVGSDPRSDLAVLKIPGKNFPTVHMGDGAAVHRGQWSIAIGNPYGLSGEGGMCVSVGVVSAVNRSLPKLSDSENRLYADLIQTTAQINPGNSGGPLLDLHGDVIGINTAVIMPQKQVNGIGFAMPITTRLLDTVKQLEQGNEIVYGYLGVVVSTPSDDERRSAGVQQPIGALVDSTQPQSPADHGVIRISDIIIRVNNQIIDDSDGFARIIGTCSIAEPVEIELMRDRKPVKLHLTLRKRQLPVAAVTRANQRLRWGGMLLGPAIVKGKSTGLVVVDINPASPFVTRGLHEGSIILSVAGHRVNGVAELQNIINDNPLDRCDFVTAPENGISTAALPTNE